MSSFLIRNAVVILAASLLIFGCRDHTPEAIQPATYDGATLSMGALDGALATGLANAFAMTPYTGANDAASPVFIPGTTIATLNEGQQAALRGIFAALHPILLVNAAKADIDALNAILQTGLNFTLPEGSDTVEVYALDREDDGHLFQWHQYSPALEDGQQDTDENRIQRVNMLVEWMLQNGTRMQTEGAKAAEAAFKVNNYVDLVAASTCLTDQFSRTDGYSKTYKFAHYIYACHSTVTNRDWFYVRQEIATDFSAAYRRSNYVWDGIGMPYDTAGPYLDTLYAKAFVVGCLNNDDLVYASQSYPPTTSSGGIVASSVDYYIPENLLYNVNGATGTGVEGGAFLQKTQFDATGFSVTNQCYSEGNNAQWKYQVNRSWAYNWFLYAQLTDVPAQAAAKFNPIHQWVWQMSPEARANTPKMAVDYEVTGVQSTAKVITFFLAETQHEDKGKIAGTFYVTLPYPPTATGK